MPEMERMAMANDISWTDAARVGAHILLAEMHVMEYDPRLKVYQNMRKYQVKCEQLSQENHNLKQLLKAKGV